jgi:hypothetical protein
LASRTLDADDTAWLTLAGTSAFWATGAALDAYVGRLAQLRPAGFVLVVARPAIGCPAPGVTAEEVEGLCRTVRSLSVRVPVVVSHGDLAALPAMAAGATGLGTGWDLRQRVLGADAYQISTTIRRRGSRITHGGLLAVLKRREAEALRVRDAALSRQLVPGAHPTGGPAEWEHHVTLLNTVVNQITSRPAGRARAHEIQKLYSAADGAFRRVEGLIRVQFGRAVWLDEVRDGVDRYAKAEGW